VRVALDYEDEVDRLYAAEPGDFVAERKRLAAALRKEGRKSEAARVLELRKPTGPAWAINQLVRRQREDVDALLAAGAALEQAQAALLGGDRAGFAEARRREQDAVKRLRRSAAQALGDRATDATLDRVAATLDAAAVTAAGREQLAQGRLVAEVEPQGFEAFAGLAAAGPSRARPAPRAKAAGERARKTPGRPAGDGGAAARRKAAVARASEELEAARARAAELSAERRRAERAVQAARKELEAAERSAAQLEADEEAAAGAVDAARRALEEARGV
jgi:hypothetical protein